MPTCLYFRYLFILYGESLSSSLQATQPHIKSVQILDHDKQWIISTFADDTMLFVTREGATLNKKQVEILEFYLALTSTHSTNSKLDLA